MRIWSTVASFFILTRQGKGAIPGDGAYLRLASLRPNDKTPFGTEDTLSTVVVPPLTVTPLITSGPSENRIDLTFFSDGYLPDEYDKFLQDARRLADDISGNQTFNTVKPLLNFWAAFTPSRESGIGVGGIAKDTPFGLYRDGTELRGVYYEYPDVARAACDSLGTRCDYPILLGNDPLYGGLGGEFTVITSSLLNGPLVLRHELGHSIIDVGEEYDGASTYFGANHIESPSKVTWKHWLTNSTTTPRVEHSAMPYQRYTWTLLNSSAPWSASFESTGLYPRNMLLFSLSGLPEATDLKVELDGVDVQWKPRPDIGVDRWFYEIHREQGFAEGKHTIKVTLLNGEREGTAQLCSMEVLEFGSESEFESKPGHYSLYPTFAEDGSIYYRPTNDDCLMRLVTTPNFCSVCMEALWLALLRRVSFIDDLSVTTCSPSAQTKTLGLSLVPVGQLRQTPIDGLEEAYDITWSKDGKVVAELNNKLNLTLSIDASGTYKVDVHYKTQEVRVDKEGLLKDSRSIDVTSGC